MERNTPFDEMQRVFDEMERMFGEMRRSVGGSALGDEVVFDVHREGEEFVVLADLPGFEREEISIRAEDGQLVLDATHEIRREEFERTRRVHGETRLPAGVDVDEASATYRNGVLEIRLPISESAGHRIDVED
jgi:HSP20 family protein